MDSLKKMPESVTLIRKGGYNDEQIATLLKMDLDAVKNIR